MDVCKIKFLWCMTISKTQVEVIKGGDALMLAEVSPDRPKSRKNLVPVQ